MKDVISLKVDIAIQDRGNYMKLGLLAIIFIFWVPTFTQSLKLELVSVAIGLVFGIASAVLTYKANKKINRLIQQLEENPS